MRGSSECCLPDECRGEGGALRLVARSRTAVQRIVQALGLLARERSAVMYAQNLGVRRMLEHVGTRSARIPTVSTPWGPKRPP